MRIIIKKLVITLAVVSSFISVNAFAKEVELFSAESTSYYYEGGMQSASFQILVENLAYEKKVFLHYSIEGGQWRTIEGSYIAPVNYNRELWEVTFTTPLSYGGDIEYVIGYEVNGVTYWDNNNGENYTIGLNDGVYLNKTNVLSLRNRNSLNSIDTEEVRPEHNIINFKVTAAVNNLAYDKTVTVVYTIDNWETTEEFSLSFVSSWSYGYTTVYSPNPLNVEIWQNSVFIHVGEKSSELKYYIKYQTDDNIYYDNNFTMDYTVQLKR
jgi:hypothetical protein